MRTGHLRSSIVLGLGLGICVVACGESSMKSGNDAASGQKSKTETGKGDDDDDNGTGSTAKKTDDKGSQGSTGGTGASGSGTTQQSGSNGGAGGTGSVSVTCRNVTSAMPLTLDEDVPCDQVPDLKSLRVVITGAPAGAKLIIHAPEGTTADNVLRAGVVACEATADAETVCDLTGNAPDGGFEVSVYLGDLSTAIAANALKTVSIKTVDAAPPPPAPGTTSPATPGCVDVAKPIVRIATANDVEVGIVYAGDPTAAREPNYPTHDHKIAAGLSPAINFYADAYPAGVVCKLHWTRVQNGQVVDSNFDFTTPGGDHNAPPKVLPAGASDSYGAYCNVTQCDGQFVQWGVLIRYTTR